MLFLTMQYDRALSQVSVLSLDSQRFFPDVRTSVRVVYTILVDPDGDEGRDWSDQLFYWLRAVNVREQDARIVRALITRQVHDILQVQKQLI